MSQYFPIQTSFSAGQVSPRIFGQVGTPVYERGVEELRNFLALSQGPAKRRPAFRFIGDVEVNGAIDATEAARVIPFDINENVSFILVLTDLRLDIWNLNGPAVDNNIIADGDFFEELEAFTIDKTLEGTVTYNSFQRGAELNATAQGGSTAAIEQTITVLTTGTHTFLGKFINQIPGSGANARIMIGTALGLADIFDANTDSNPLFSSGAIALTVGTVFFRIEMTAGAGHFVLDNLQLLDAAGTGPISVVTPWTDREIGEIQWALPPNEATIFLVQQDHDPHEILLDLASGLFTFQTIPLTAPPVEWTGSNFPGTIAFFQGRSWFASTPDQPETIWGSQSAALRNFDFGTGLPAEAIQFQMNQRGAIRWMAGLKEFLIATEIQENILTSDQGIIKTGDVEALQQSAYGSAFIQSEQIGDQVLYLTGDRTKLRAEYQSFIESGWIAQDLTFPSESLLKGFGSRGTRIAFARDPEQIIWVRREDGTLAGCTYERSLEIVGWHQHEVGASGTPDSEGVKPFPAEIIDIAPINFQGIDLIVAVTRRFIDGAARIYLEELDIGLDIFQESWLEFTLPTLTDTITGLGHLEGETVQVLVDDAVDPDTVVSGGVITTQVEGFNFKIGLRAKCRMVTLSKTGGNQSGTAQGTLRRNIEVFVRLRASTVPILNGVRPPDRTPSTPMDTPEPLRTQDTKVMDLGYDEFGKVTVEETIPKNVEVLALFGKTDVQHV